MLVDKNLRLKGIIYYTYRQNLYFIFISSLVYILYYQLGYTFLTIPFVPLGVLGTALAIFLAFRNNSSYSRWWEGRTLWGNISGTSRNLGRQLNSMMSSSQFKKQIIYRHIAYVNALRLKLRNQSEWEILLDFLNPDEYQLLLNQINKPYFLLIQQSLDLELAVNKNHLKDNRVIIIDNTLRELANLQAGCERIKETPFLRQYDFFTRVFIWIFVTLLPLSFIKDMGILTIPFCLLISFIFMVLSLIGGHNENPFENKIQDVPMTSICRIIERDLKSILGETQLPTLIEPINGVLM